MRNIILSVAVAIGALLMLPHGSQGVEDFKARLDYANPDLPSLPAATVTADAARLTHEYRMTQERYRLYECIALSVVVIVSLITVLLFITKKTTYSSTHVVNASGLILIIFGTIFLVILTDAESQLSTGIGVMGAIAGYLFGKIQKGEAQAEGVQAGGEGKGN